MRAWAGPFSAVSIFHIYVARGMQPRRHEEHGGNRTEHSQHRVRCLNQIYVPGPLPCESGGALGRRRSVGCHYD